MAELADAPDSKSGGRKAVWVRFPPPAPIVFYIIAGPNGARKTTFAREFLPNYAGCKNFSMPIRLHKVFRHSDAVSVRRDD